MILAIMQPYAFPYLGYFQLIHAADRFVVLDNVSYSKGGWINRNRLGSHAGPQWFRFPVKRVRQGQPISDVCLHEAEHSRSEFLRTVDMIYRRAPHYASVRPMIDIAVAVTGNSLANCLIHMLNTVCAFLEIGTPIVRASHVHAEINSHGVDRIIAICQAEGAHTYINPEGGSRLYDDRLFYEHDIELRFLKHTPEPYPHYCRPFAPRLSIIDLMMFNGRDTLATILNKYRLVIAKEINNS